MARANDKVICNIEGYEVVRGRAKGSLLLSHGYYGNYVVTQAFLQDIIRVLSIPEFRRNFYDKNTFVRLEETLVSLGSRPNVQILAVLQGTQIFKASDFGAVFVTNVQGANYVFSISMLEQLYYLYNNDYTFRKMAGLEG